MSHSFPVPVSRYFVIDSFPLPVCRFGRARYCAPSVQMGQSMEDACEGLRDFAERCLGLVIPGDKGYTGESLYEDMCRRGICLMSLKLSNYKKNWPADIRRLIFRFRRHVETVFSQFSEQLNAEKVLAKSTRGLYTRLKNKILEHNLCRAFENGITLFQGFADDQQFFRERCDIGKI